MVDCWRVYRRFLLLVPLMVVNSIAAGLLTPVQLMGALGMMEELQRKTDSVMEWMM